MKRTVIFAHYDKDNLIDDYIIYYLQALKKLSDKIVFVSCCEITDIEKSKLFGIADYIIAEKHDEYDFGSYKRGFFHLKNLGILEDFDELILANDSCFAPLYPLEPVFEKMSYTKCDFWGITKNRFGVNKKDGKFLTVIRPHIQSYFLVLSNKIFTGKIFENFMDSVKHENEKGDIIINYEIGLSELLENNGFFGEVYIKDYYRYNHVVLSLWRELIKNSESPFLKCSIFKLVNPELTTIANWQNFLRKYTNYPSYLIEKNIERTALRKQRKNFIPAEVKILHFYFISRLPGFLKRKFAILTKKYLTFLTD